MGNLGPYRYPFSRSCLLETAVLRRLTSVSRIPSSLRSSVLCQHAISLRFVQRSASNGTPRPIIGLEYHYLPVSGLTPCLSSLFAKSYLERESMHAR